MPLVQELRLPDGRLDDRFGAQLALDGTTAATAIADRGKYVVVLYENDGTPAGWSEDQRISAFDGEPVAEMTNLALAGDVLAVGDPGSASGDAAGAVHVYRRDLVPGLDYWKFAGSLDSSSWDGYQPGLRFGFSVALSGDILAVGAPGGLGGTGAPITGRVYLFRRNPADPLDWLEIARLTAPDGAPGDTFGFSLALDGDTLAVGAPYAYTFDPVAGAVYVFERHLGGSDGWGLRERLAGSGSQANDRLGWSLGVSGDTLAAGIHQGLHPYERQGGVYLFERHLGGPDAWGERTFRRNAAELWDALGYRIALDGDLLVAGAPGPARMIGDMDQAYVYHRHQGGTEAWGRVARLTDPIARPGDAFGRAVAASGTTLLVGSPSYDAGVGAAFVFEARSELSKTSAFNLFVFKDLDQTYSDAGGRVAVGNDARLTGYDVAAQLPYGHLDDSLVVGGDLTFTGGSVRGTVVYGGTAAMSGVTVDGTVGHGHPIDFAAEAAYLDEASQLWASLPANGTTTVEWGKVRLVGADPELNVFDVSGAALSGAWGFSIDAPAGSTVLVSIDGHAVTLRWLNLLLSGGVSGDHVLLNFHQAQSLTIEGVGITAAMLAPRAAVGFDNGLLTGTLICESLTGNGQLNPGWFLGDLPPLP